MLQIPRSSSEMALPRWVLSERVDSAGMLSAYQSWRAANPEMAKQMGLDKGLPTINHCPDAFPFPKAGVIEVRCPRGMSCKRCSEGRAGYTFRWFSCLWLDSYKSWRAPGTWLPGDPEGYRVTRGLRDFSGEILNSRGLLVDCVGPSLTPTLQVTDTDAHASSRLKSRC